MRGIKCDKLCMREKKKKMSLGLPGFEPGLVDSESTVLAITPQAHCICRMNPA